MVLKLSNYFFLISASAKFNLPPGTNVVLKDSAGVAVDADIFDEFVRTSKASFRIVYHDQSGKKLA